MEVAIRWGSDLDEFLGCYACLCSNPGPGRTGHCVRFPLADGVWVGSIPVNCIYSVWGRPERARHCRWTCVSTIASIGSVCTLTFGNRGVARNGGGAIAVGVYSSVLSNTQGGRAATLVPAAAIGAGLPASSVPAVLKALPLGSVALRAVPGMDSRTAAAVGLAWQQSYAWGLK